MSTHPNASAWPLRVNAHGRWLEGADGQPFFWLGDTAWPLFAQYTRAEAEAYLANRGAKGYTVIQGVLAWGGGTGFEDKQPGPNYAGHRPWIEGRPDRPNPAYFEHVDALLQVAAEHGLILGMLPTWGYYVNETGVLDPANARAYGIWLGERFKDTPNLVWINGGDRIPTGSEATWRALGQGLRQGDGGAHLITYHPCGWRSSAQFWQQEDWLDVHMIETWTQWPQVYPAVLADTLLTPRRPVILGEGAYENGPEYPLGPITPLIVRRQAWWAFMAGGYFTNGQDRMWRMGEGWLDTLDTPAAGQMTVFKQIATSRPWWKMVPDQGLFDAGVSCERTLNTALRAVDGSCAMLYLASQCHVRINLDKILTKQCRATLADPRTGELHDLGVRDTGNGVGVFPKGQHRWFSVPGHWEDAVLILDAVEE
jgi:hypothetical protein